MASVGEYDKIRWCQQNQLTLFTQVRSKNYRVYEAMMDEVHNYNGTSLDFIKALLDRPYSDLKKDPYVKAGIWSSIRRARNGKKDVVLGLLMDDVDFITDLAMTDDGVILKRIQEDFS